MIQSTPSLATDTRKQAFCRSCNAPIWWAVTDAGRKMPVDWEPVPNGNVIALTADTVRYANKAATPVPGQVRYRSHFSSCPDAAKHRKAGGRS